MERLATVVLAGLLGYICLLLTSINNKIDTLYELGTQYAILDEVKHDSYNNNDIQQVVFRDENWRQISAANAAFLLAALVCVFVSWHLSRIYHTHQWTKTILRKTFANYGGGELCPLPTKPEPIHPDQDCVAEAPISDDRIKTSWLPARLRGFYAERERGKAEG